MGEYVVLRMTNPQCFFANDFHFLKKECVYKKYISQKVLKKCSLLTKKVTDFKFLFSTGLVPQKLAASI